MRGLGQSLICIRGKLFSLVLATAMLSIGFVATTFDKAMAQAQPVIAQLEHAWPIGCTHREPRIPEDYPLQPVRPIHAIVHNRIRYTLGAEAAWGLCVADRRDPLPPVVGLSAALHPAPGSARLARLPGNGREPLPTPA